MYFQALYSTLFIPPGIPSGSLGVKVINVTTSHSLFVVQAHVIQEVGLDRPHNGELITILFDDDTMKMLKLQTGSFVSICPPWCVSLVCDVCVCVRACVCVSVVCDVCVCVCMCVCACVCVVCDVYVRVCICVCVCCL